MSKQFQKTAMLFLMEKQPIRPRRRRLPLVSEHKIRLQSGFGHLWLMTMADVPLKAQPVME